MTYQQAIAVRTLQLSGVPMLDSVLNEAMSIIRNTRTPTAYPKYGIEADAAADPTPREVFSAAIDALEDNDVPAAVSILRTAVGRSRVMGGQVVEVKA